MLRPAIRSPYGLGKSNCAEARREIPVHCHILGVCGTFMGGLAAWCVAEGWTVTGSDHAVYPPMSDQLRGLGITLSEGSDLTQLQPRPDLVVIGNALSRGHPVVEAVLDQGIPFLSGPALWGSVNTRSDRAGGIRNAWENHHIQSVGAYFRCRRPQPWIFDWWCSP